MTNFEALFYLARWFKTNTYYYADQQKFETFKMHWLKIWLAQNHIKATHLVKQNSLAMNLMKEAIDNRGENFELLTWSGDAILAELQSHPNYQQYAILSDFVQGFLGVPISEPLLKERQAQYQQELEQYQKDLENYHLELERYEDLSEPYELMQEKAENEQKFWIIEQYRSTYRELLQKFSLELELTPDGVEVKKVCLAFLQKVHPRIPNSKMLKQINYFLKKWEISYPEHKIYRALLNFLENTDQELNQQAKDVKSILPQILKQNEIKLKNKKKSKIYSVLDKYLFPYPECPYKMPKKPNQPKPPFFNQVIDPDNYDLVTQNLAEEGKKDDSFDQIVSISELNQAIKWAEKILKRSLKPEDFDDYLVHCEIESAMQEEILSQRVEKALTIFQQVLSEQLTDPEEIYDQLVEIELDYSCIGMNPYIDHRNDCIQQRDFCQWHEINFNRLKYSLIEFEVIGEPNLKFYQSIYDFSPDEQQQFLAKLSWKNSEEILLKPLSEQEQVQYPPHQLLPLLNLSIDQFSYGLQPHSKEYPWQDFTKSIEDFDESGYEF